MHAYIIEQLEKLSFEDVFLNNLSGVKSEEVKGCVEPSYNIPPNKCFEPDEDGDTCLHMAIAGGYWRAADWLVRSAPAGGQLGVADAAGQTGLHLAVVAGRPHLVRLMLAAGAPPDARDATGRSPLHLAVRAGDLACCAALLDPFTPLEMAQLGMAGRDTPAPPRLEQWDHDGMTCMHVAVERDDVAMLRALVEAGGDVNAREGRAGHTPLHMALQHGRQGALDFLLDSCPTLDPAVPSYGGLAPTQMVCPLAPRLASKVAARGTSPPPQKHALRINAPGRS